MSSETDIQIPDSANIGDKNENYAQARGTWIYMVLWQAPS